MQTDTHLQHIHILILIYTAITICRYAIAVKLSSHPLLTVGGNKRKVFRIISAVVNAIFNAAQRRTAPVTPELWIPAWRMSNLRSGKVNVFIK